MVPFAKPEAAEWIARQTPRASSSGTALALNSGIIRLGGSEVGGEFVYGTLASLQHSRHRVRFSYLVL